MLHIICPHVGWTQITSTAIQPQEQPTLSAMWHSSTTYSCSFHFGGLGVEIAPGAEAAAPHPATLQDQQSPSTSQGVGYGGGGNVFYTLPQTLSHSICGGSYIGASAPEIDH